MSDTNRAVGGAERIAKTIARAGLCSRREAEALIAAGRVTVNGKVILSPALDVTAADRIVVDGEPLPERERTRLFLYHKPRGLVTTNADPEGRPTIFDALPKGAPRLISVGRLDINSEGLLLLTNDGGLARALELPQTAWLRRYRVRAHGTVKPEQLAALRNGIVVDGVRYGSIEAILDRAQGSNVWITFAMREGKNREVRNVLGALGLAVNRLIRVSYGPFQLGELPEGAIEEVPTRHLREQIGERVAADARANFSGPITQIDAPEEQRPRLHTGRPKGDAPTPGKSGKRHRGRDHVWREEGKPVRAKFRGTRAERRQPREQVEQGDTDIFTDRKGRPVTLVRIGGKRPDEERKPRRPRNEAKRSRVSMRSRRAADRRSGPRPSRPR